MNEDKQYTHITSNIGQYKKSVYELYFNTIKIGKWVNSSRLPESVIEEILEKYPNYINNQYSYITRLCDGEKETIWEYRREQKKVEDRLTGEIYKNIDEAVSKTGISKRSIVGQFNQLFGVKKRFKYL